VEGRVPVCDTGYKDIVKLKSYVCEATNLNSPVQASLCNFLTFFHVWFTEFSEMFGSLLYIMRAFPRTVLVAATHPLE
jgi:hypothetical protein